MLRASARRLARLLLIGALASAPTLGCNPGPRGPADPSAIDHSLPPVEVDDAGFASAVHRLMRDGKPTAQRSALLAGTVRRQLAHAATSFRSGDSVHGANAVVGALYLVRAGEARHDMFERDGLFAIDGAFRRFSALGDEGRALALMLTERSVLPPDSPRIRELDQHRAALSRWLDDTRPMTAMERLTTEKRNAVAGALLNPSEETLRAAEKAINKWVARAVEINLAYQRTKKAPSRAVIVDAYRALQIGSETMAAVFLRHGRAKDAVTALDEGAAGRVADAQLFTRLQGAADGDSAEDWRLLTQAFRQRALDDQEVMMDTQLMDAVMWGVALEAYRRDPTSYRVGHALANHLGAYGLSEVAPLVLGDALGTNPTTVSLSGVMRVIEESLRERFEAGDVTTARRIYGASKRALSIADGARYRSRVKPSSSKVRHLMARIELRAGGAEQARQLMTESLEAEPSLRGYVELANVERQLGKLEPALNHARQATKLPTAKVTPLAIAQAHFLSFELLRRRGDRSAALSELNQALTRVIEKKNLGTVTQRVHSELLLARILHSYGAHEKASRAIDHAIAMMGHGQTLADEILIRALHLAVVHRDVYAARAALQMGFKANLSTADMVRGALWLLLLERELGAETDGKVERVLVDAADGKGWWNLAARWARELVSDDELRAASRDHTERVRADFYIAMRSRARKEKTAEMEKSLRGVANASVFWEPEVQLARDLLAPQLTAELPASASDL